MFGPALAFMARLEVARQLGHDTTELGLDTCLEFLWWIRRMSQIETHED